MDRYSLNESMVLDVERFTLRARACDLCGETSGEGVWSYEHVARTKGGWWLWDVNNVVCARCGFVYVTPAPDHADLDRYYSDSFARYEGETAHYDLDTRMAHIQAHRPGGGEVFVEVGAGSTVDFRREIRKTFKRCLFVEPNQNYEESFDRREGLREGEASVVASYFVAEHVPDTGRFLADCARMLRPGGVLILEVPNLYVYPKVIGGLILFEHLSHFSPRTLARLAAARGLGLVKLYDPGSRRLGFAAVFEKGRKPGAEFSRHEDGMEKELAHACMRGGLELASRYEAELDEARRLLLETSRQGKKGVIWAANYDCLRLLKGFTPPEGVIVVDNDPGKSGFLGPFPTHFAPDVADHIRDSQAFVICTFTHAEAIKDWAKENTGAIITRQNSRVLDRPFGL